MSSVFTEVEIAEILGSKFATNTNTKNEIDMGKITLAYPVERIQGKVNKKDSAYFCRRYGRNYINRIVDPFTGEASEVQELQQEKFATCVAKVNDIVSDATSSEYTAYEAAYKSNSEDYVTLRGYIFAKEFAKL